MCIVGYGFKADTSMLIASYPIFEKALSSGKTLLDLCLVHADVSSSDYSCLIENLFVVVNENST